MSEDADGTLLYFDDMLNCNAGFFEQLCPSARENVENAVDVDEIVQGDGGQQDGDDGDDGDDDEDDDDAGSDNDMIYAIHEIRGDDYAEVFDAASNVEEAIPYEDNDAAAWFESPGVDVVDDLIEEAALPHARCCERWCLFTIDQREPGSLQRFKDYIVDLQEKIAHARGCGADAQAQRAAAKAELNRTREFIVQYMSEKGSCTRAIDEFVSRTKLYEMKLADGSIRRLKRRRIEEELHEASDGSAASVLSIRNACCKNDCVNRIIRTSDVVRAWRADMQSAGGNQRARRFVTYDFYRKTPGACVAVAQELLGVSRDVARQMRTLSQDPSAPDRLVHGLHGLVHYFAKNPPVNLNLKLDNAVVTFLEIHTLGDPESTSGNIYVNPSTGASGMKSLWRLFCTTMADDQGQLAFHNTPWTTWRDAVARWLRVHGYVKLIAVKADHNVCPHCKRLAIAHHNLALQWATFHSTKSVGDQLSPLDRAQKIAMEKQAKMITFSTAVHRSLDIRCREMITWWATIAKRQLKEMEANENRPRWCEFASNSGVAIFHVDAETSRQLPNVLQKTGAENLCGHSVRTVGFQDLRTGRQHNYLFDDGVGKEDTSSIIDLILLHALKQRGEAVLIIVCDCFNVNYTSLVWALLSFLVDELGMFKGAGMLYYQRRHGKGPCDQRFGQHRKVWASTALFSIDQFGYAIQNRINASDNSKPESCTIVPSTALSDWKSFFTVRSNGVLPADKRCKINSNQYNQIFAVRAGIENDETIANDLKQELSRFVTKPGFVAVRRLDGLVRALPLWPSQLAPAAEKLGKPAARYKDVVIDDADEHGVSRNPSRLKYRMRRAEHLKNGYNFSRCPAMLDKETSERFFKVNLLPETWAGVDDNRVQMLTHVERVPACGEFTPATGPVCPTVTYANVMKGRAESNTQGLVFVNHRVRGETFLPAVVTEANPGYRILRVYGARISETPQEVVRISDLVELVSPLEFDFNSPPPTCSLQDWFYVKPAFGDLPGFKYAPGSIDVENLIGDWPF